MLADGYTDIHTDRHDRQTQTGFIICPMLYAIAMGQIKQTQREEGGGEEEDEHQRTSESV